MYTRRFRQSSGFSFKIRKLRVVHRSWFRPRSERRRRSKKPDFRSVLGLNVGTDRRDLSGRFGDTPFHQVADRYHSEQSPALHHR